LDFGRGLIDQRPRIQAWQNGKIGVERYELKGLFMDICGYYWVQDCHMTLPLLEKKFPNDKNMIKELIDLGILKHERRHNRIEVEFLVNQRLLLNEKRKVRQDAGSKGGKAKAKLKQNPSYKDNNKDKIDIELRKTSFASTLEPFLKIYGRDMLNEFFKYWTEPNKSKSKFRAELEKTWDVERRLETWARNDKNFKPPTKLGYSQLPNAIV
jgi:hypothetical protein